MYSKKFNVTGHWAKTLEPEYIGKHDNGWEIEGEIISDYYQWINNFTAKKGKWKVWGDFEKEVFATNKKAYTEFVNLFPPLDWDYGDI